MSNKLTHSTLWLNQQTTDALENGAKFSTFHEIQHFINDIPIFKAKDPKSFDDWLEQIDKVASLTNKDPYKLALAKSWGLFSRMICSFLLSLHSDNGMEFKSKFIEYLSQQLDIKRHISPCHPQANGKLESSHRFIKDCQFSIDDVLEWDQLLPYAAAAFNWFPNEHSQESTHFLYFRCDPYLSHLASFCSPN